MPDSNIDFSKDEYGQDSAWLAFSKVMEEFGNPLTREFLVTWPELNFLLNRKFGVGAELVRFFVEEWNKRGWVVYSAHRGIIVKGVNA